MARKTSTLADVPFHDYLRQFLAQNRKRVRATYTPLTRKLLDFNDPDKGGEAFLRRPQFEALEIYVFLKEYCGNARLSDVFRQWQDRTGPFEGRGTFGGRPGELSLFEEIDAHIRRIVPSALCGRRRSYAQGKVRRCHPGLLCLL